MIACWVLTGVLLAAEGVAPVGVAVTYPPGLFYEVAAHKERKVRHLIVALGQGMYRIKGGRVVSGFMAQSDSNYWPGIRYMDVQVWNPVQRRWSPPPCGRDFRHQQKASSRTASPRGAGRARVGVDSGDAG